MLTLLLLVALDTVFTLCHLGLGIDEANPIMRWALDAGGVMLFTVMKAGITLLALAFLLAHIRFRPTQFLLVIALAVYTGILGVHLYVFQLTTPA